MNELLHMYFTLKMSMSIAPQGGKQRCVNPWEGCSFIFHSAKTIELADVLRCNETIQ